VVSGPSLILRDGEPAAGSVISGRSDPALIVHRFPQTVSGASLVQHDGKSRPAPPSALEAEAALIVYRFPSTVSGPSGITRPATISGVMRAAGAVAAHLRKW